MTNDDFVLLRKDVSTERVFNIAIITVMFSFLGARIFFIILNPSSSFFNPLIFLLFPYFPGLSLIGGLVVGIISFFALTIKDSNLPSARLFDFFAVSFLTALPFGLTGFFLLSKSKIFFFNEVGIYAVLLIIFLKLLLPRLVNGKFREGTIGLIFLILFSLISLIEHFAGTIAGKIHFNIEDLVLLVIFFGSGIIFIKHEKLLGKIKIKTDAKKIK